MVHESNLLTINSNFSGEKTKNVWKLPLNDTESESWTNSSINRYLFLRRNIIINAICSYVFKMICLRHETTCGTDVQISYMNSEDVNQNINKTVETRTTSKMYPTRLYFKVCNHCYGEGRTSPHVNPYPVNISLSGSEHNRLMYRSHASSGF